MPPWRPYRTRGYNAADSVRIFVASRAVGLESLAIADDEHSSWKREMPDATSYRIEYSPATAEHLAELTARQRPKVFDAVEKQLSHEPAVETRNRKPMRPNPLAPWELRIETLRVYYDVVDEPEKVVTVLAIGTKKGNRVYIGGEEFEL